MGMIIAIDFDGTCVTHEYPEIGKEIGAATVLRELIRNGHKLILFTMRSGECLEAAVNWFNVNNIKLYGINRNPTQYEWTTSPKVYAQLYIDDAALGIPLLKEEETRHYVDWEKVSLMLQNNKIIIKEAKQ